jgi:two-component system response regulator CpxR
VTVAVIAIFSGSYCHGEEVAEKVSGQLGLALLEERLLEETERKFGISKKKLRNTMAGSASILNKFTREREKNIACLKTVLAELVQEDDKLLYGHAAHLLPDTIGHVLKVCVIANHDYRVSRVTSTESKSQKEADRIIRKDDEERLEWTRYLFDKSPYDENLYDIVIPTHSSSIDEAVQLVVEHAGSERLATTADSKQAARDFLLSTQVNLALVNAGYDMEVHSQSGQVTITINEYVVRLKHLEEELKQLAGQISGVQAVVTRTGHKFRAPSSNPWANIEGPPKVLLVDDEKEYVHALSERLETRNIGSSVVYDGTQALDFVEKDEPDVMVLDLMMPGIDGIEVLRRLKKQRPHIEVIILTGHGSQREEVLAKELGAFAYLQKPVDVDDLAEVMKKAYRKASVSKGSSGMDSGGTEPGK